MVIGGANSPTGKRETKLDSTEMLMLEDTEWRTLPTAILPSPRWDLVAATLDNKVFIFGKNIVIIRHPHSTSNDINVDRRRVLRGSQHHSQLQCEEKYLGTRWPDDQARLRFCSRGH